MHRQTRGLTKELTQGFAIAVAINFLHGMGSALPVAAASAESSIASSRMQNSVDGSIDLQQDLLASSFFQQDSSTTLEQAHETSTKLSQYSDNPTIPGDGTPQRSQGSGTR